MNKLINKLFYVMCITIQTLPSNHTYSIKGSALAKVTTHTYLGVDIDSKLNWTAHCNRVKKRASQTLGLVQRTLHAAPRASKELAYKALVRPKLEYATTAWNPQTSGKIKKLESVQNKAARFTTRDYRRQVKGEDIVRSLKWDTLETRRAVKDVTMWHKVVNNQVQLPFPPTVLPKPRLNYQDHPLAYLHIRPRIDAYKFSFFVRTIPLWNGLPIGVVYASTPESFQRLALDHMRVQPSRA